MTEIPAAAFSPDGELVNFRDAKVFVRETGRGAPLLLINGLGAHTEMWRPLEAALDGFRIIEFDLPGAGRSPAPRRPVRMKRLARLCRSIMDHAGMDVADVLGYSMGGMVAQQLAADLPERVRRLVLVATTPGVGAVQADPKALLNILTPARYSSARLYAKTLASMVGGRARNDPDWIAEQSRVRFLHRPTWRGYLGQLNSMAGWSALPLLSRVEQPTLVLSGGDDPLAPAVNGMMIASLLGNGRLLVLDGEGHLMVLDETGGSHPAIRDFLTSKNPYKSAVWGRAANVRAEDVRDELSRARRQLPPLSLLDAAARWRWLADVE